MGLCLSPDPERHPVTEHHRRNPDAVPDLEAARQRISELESEKAQRKRAERVLRKNAEFLRGILDTTALASVFVADRNGTIVFANPRTEDVFGLPLDQFIGRSCLTDDWQVCDPSGQRLRPEDDPFVRARDSGQRVTNQMISLVRGDGSIRHLIINAAPMRDHAGHITHVVVAANDITDLKHTEEAYRVLVEDSAQGFSLFQDNRVVYVNPALVEMAGCRLEDLIGLNADEAAERFIHPDDRQATVASFQSVALGASPPQPTTYRLVRPDGGVRHLQSYVGLTHYKGRPAVQIVNVDITERVSAAKALEDSRRNFQELFNRLEDFVFVISLDGRIIEANPSTFERLGYSEEQLLGQAALLLYPPERRWEAQEVFAELLAGRRTACELPLLTASGAVIPVDTKVSFGLWNGDRVLYAVSRDISERLKAEQKIREGERRFAEALQAFRHVLYRFNMRENRYDYLSPHIREFTGFSYEEFASKGLGEIVKEFHPDDLPRLQAAMRDAVEHARGNTASLTIELRRRFKDGTYHWLSDSMMLVLDANRSVEAIVGSVHDIEEYKRAEDALRRKGQHLQKLLQAAPVILFAADLNGVCTALEGRGLEAFHIDPAQLIGKPMRELYAGRPIMKAWIERALAGEEFSVEYVDEHSGRALIGHVAQLRDARGKREGIVVIHVDITEQKTAQRALNNAHAMFFSFAEKFPGVMFIKDEESRILFANAQMRERFAADTWIGKRTEEVLPREAAEKSIADDRAAFATGSLLVEETLTDRHGRTRTWRTWKFPLTGETDTPRLLGGISYDITEQRQAERAYRTLVENSLQGLALVRNGRVVFVNAQASAITGYSREELMALTEAQVFGLILPADHALVLDRIQRRQCGEELAPMFHMRLIRGDGAVRRLLVYTSAIEFETVPVVQIAFMDVTDFPEARYGGK